MNTKKTTIIIEDTDKNIYRQYLNETLALYSEDDIINIDTGMTYIGRDSRGNPEMNYYAIIIIRGNGWT